MRVSEFDILGASILVVDDQEWNIRLLEQLLADTGYTRVMSTMQPENVVSLHRQHSFDVILLDLQMPVMDGFQVMEALQSSIFDYYIPVIVLTAQPDQKLRALKAGARDFISKPFDLFEVKTRIRNMLEVRLLYKKIESYSNALEQTILDRTAELRESEARYRSLTELASDWNWEQDENGKFTRVSGPALDILGVNGDSVAGTLASNHMTGWNESERDALREAIAARKPFVDFSFSRTAADGSRQLFRASGEPMFNHSGRFMGYRGIGVECRPN